MELLSFLTINALQWKPSLLASKLLDHGYDSVMQEVIRDTCSYFDLDASKFRDSVHHFSDQATKYSSDDIDKLTARISKSNFNAKNEIKKILRYEW
jgi:hypothetical protein